MEKGKIIRLVLIPIVAGLIVTLIVQRLMTASSTAATTPKVDTVPVVMVATKEPIPARTKLTESQLVVKQMPRELTNGTEFASPKDLVGKIAMIDLQPGEVVRQSRVAEEGKGALPYRIPEGKRAITIRLDELNGIAGHPEIGDLVDVILYLAAKKNEQGGESQPASARILFEGVPVLDKGIAPSQAGAAAPKPGENKLSSITLAVTPQQATELTLAEQIGYLKMVLRPALKQPDAGPVIVTDQKYSVAPSTAHAPAPAQTGR